MSIVGADARPDSSPVDAMDGAASAEAGTTEASMRVSGRVMAADWGRGASGRKVVIGAQSVFTDSGGSFSFEMVPAAYDVIVGEPDGTHLAVYQGLSRRDPILSYPATYDPVLDDPPHRATVAGVLSGDFPFPLDENHVVTAYYASDRTRASVQLSNLPGTSPGPGYGPFTIRWNGSSSISGNLVVIGQYGVRDNPWLGAAVALQSLDLSAGDALTRNVILGRVANGNIAGTVQVYEGDAVQAIQFSYHLADAMGMFSLGEYPSRGAFDCLLPDLSSLGGEYCASVVDVRGTVQATKCGGQIGMRDFSFRVQTPPRFEKPTNGSPITKESRLSWTGAESAVYLLTALPDVASTDAPRIHVYGATTQLAWPDLGPLGIEFPAGTTYTYQVSALLPYASMDAFASTKGPYRDGIDRQQLDSEAISLVLIR